MTNYGGKTVQVIIELNGSQTVRAYGYGDFYGHSSVAESMCFFTGFRIGA